MKISVVIPTYNSEKTIGILIDSLLKQSVLPYEIIIADGSSSDSTEEICNAFNSSLVKVIINSSGHQTGSNRNLGAHKAKGDYLLFLDSDCIADKDLIKNFLEEINNNMNITYFAGNVLIANPGKVSNIMYLQEKLFLYNSIKDGFVTGSFFWVMNCCVKKDSFIEFPDTSYSEDMVFIDYIVSNNISIKFCKNAKVHHKYADTKEIFFKKRLNSFKGFIDQREHITHFEEDSPFNIILKLLTLDLQEITKIIKDKIICFDKSRKISFDVTSNEFRFQNIPLLSAVVAVFEYKGGKLDVSYSDLVKKYSSKKNVDKYNEVNFSIIIPTYNSGKTIGKLIESLLSQSILPYEIIVVDGNSTDKTRDICNNFNNPIIKVIKNPNGHETGTNRNLGVEYATSKYLIFIDSDCIAEKNLIKTYYEKINNNSNINCIAGNVLLLNPSRVSSKAYLSEKYLINENSKIDPITKETYIKETFFWVMNFCIKKDKMIKFPDTSYSEDMVFIEKLFKTGISVLFCKKAVTFHPYPQTEFDFFRRMFKISKGFIEQKEMITNITAGSYFDIILKLLKLSISELENIIKNQNICFDENKGVVFDGHALKKYSFQNTLLLSAIVAVLEYKGEKLDTSYEELLDNYGK